MKPPPFWVLDTNVLVSGLLTPSGPCAEIIGLVRLGRIRAAWTPTILAEYAEVLQRPKFGLPPPIIANLISIFPLGWRVYPSTTIPLPDPDDEPFLAAALATTDKILVTGNVKDFPPKARSGVKVLSPREALAITWIPK